MMELYSNIKQRRIDLHLSQSELAEKVGYKDKGSISRIENGKVDIPQSMIEKFAEALDCTPSYLMGWTATFTKDMPKGYRIKPKSVSNEELMKKLDILQDTFVKKTYTITELTDDEKELIKKFRVLTDEAKDRVVKYASYEFKENYNGKSEKTTIG